MATNLLKFAHKGEILIQTISRGDQYGIEIISIDSGPGIENVSRSFEDGYSSAGSAGTGLGAIKRLSSEMEVYSAQGGG
jgi:anti-sigma regulatory factor (Ser/Thr protein kinase)